MSSTILFRIHKTKGGTWGFGVGVDNSFVEGGDSWNTRWMWNMASPCYLPMQGGVDGLESEILNKID